MKEGNEIHFDYNAAREAKEVDLRLKGVKVCVLKLSIEIFACN